MKEYLKFLLVLWCGGFISLLTILGLLNSMNPMIATILSFIIGVVIFNTINKDVEKYV